MPKLKRLPNAFKMGQRVCDKFVEHTRHDFLSREQRALLAYVVADVIRVDRSRARNKYKRKST